MLLKMQAINKTSILPKLQTSIEEITRQFDRIPLDRKAIIGQLTEFIRGKVAVEQPVLLNFICTQNSRRSHITQVWAQAAAHYYGVPGVVCFSGGNEATFFNPRAVRAMESVGFEVSIAEPGKNPVYEVKFSEGAPPIRAYSKRYDDAPNPRKDFAAIMVCSDKDTDCPVVTGAAKKISMPFDDPKDFDGGPLEAEKYKERVTQIGREILYAFLLDRTSGKHL
jgi:arsenate reductase